MKQFISNLKLSRKFALIGVLVLAMVALPVWLVIQNSVEKLSVAHAEAAGIAPAGDMLTLIKFTQQHRGQSAMVFAGNASIQGARQAKQAEVELAMAKVQQSVATDSQAPTASITSPAAGAKVSGLVSVDVAASDNVGVVKVELLVNGALVATDSDRRLVIGDW